MFTKADETLSKPSLEQIEDVEIPRLALLPSELS
jgi:hypothetical protein